MERRTGSASNIVRSGSGGNVVFHDRRSQAELTEFLAAADLYVTLYLNPEQITSGTPPTRSGEAVISTPYRYASELLADGRGGFIRAIPERSRAKRSTSSATTSPTLALGARGGGAGMLWLTSRKLPQIFERAWVEHADRLHLCSARPRSRNTPRAADVNRITSSS
jgi:hypothetical protein